MEHCICIYVIVVMDWVKYSKGSQFDRPGPATI
jgi:hypothetical protein